MKEKKKNIVILCGKYYPNLGAPAGCFFPYIKELSKTDNVIIVSQKTSYLKTDNLKYSLPFYEISNRRNNWKCRLDDVYIQGKDTPKHKLFGVLLRFWGGIKTMFLFPDQNKWMIEEYLKALNTIQSQECHIDVIISISYPFTAHIAALYYKTNINDSVKWISYSTDPYAFNEEVQYKHTLFKKRKKEWAFGIEKKIFDTADYNIVTDELYNHLLDDFKQSKKKTIAFPYLLNKKLQATNSLISNNPLKAVFAGSLYFDIRNPKAMLQLFKSLNNISLDLYVRPDSDCQKIIQEWASDNIHLHGLVDRKTYEGIIISEADILINIGNSVSLQSPSKLLELVSTGKPIINLYSIKDAGYKLIEKYPLGINVPNSEEIQNHIHSIEQFINSTSNKKISFDELSKLFPENVLDNHLNVLKKII